MSKMYDGGENFKLKQVTILAPPHALLEYEYTLNNAKSGTHNFTIQNLFKAADPYLNVVPSESNPKERNVRVLYYQWEHRGVKNWSWRRAHGILLDPLCRDLVEACAQRDRVGEPSSDWESLTAHNEAVAAVDEAYRNLMNCKDRLRKLNMGDTFEPEKSADKLCSWYHDLHHGTSSHISVIYTVEPSDLKGPIKFIVKFIVDGVSLKIGNTLTLTTKSGGCELDQYYMVAQQSGIDWVDTMISITLGPKPQSPEISQKQLSPEAIISELSPEGFDALTQFEGSAPEGQLLENPCQFGPHTIFAIGLYIPIGSSQSTLEHYLVTFVYSDARVSISRLLFLNAKQFHVKENMRLIMNGALRDISEYITDFKTEDCTEFKVFRIAGDGEIRVTVKWDDRRVLEPLGSPECTSKVEALNNSAESINLIVAQRLRSAEEEQLAPKTQFSAALPHQRRLFSVRL